MSYNDKKSLKIVFMGTPDFGLPCLDMLYDNGFDLAAVFTQPDRPAGRGHKVIETPVKKWALAHNIQVYQFEKIKDSGTDILKKINPDLCITAAFGQILTQELLDIPKYGIFNVHASLLPKLRGSAPIQWAIISGEKESGITIMRTEYALDAGDIICQDKVEIDKEMNAGVLYDKLSNLAPKTLFRALENLLDGTIVYTKQDENNASYFPKFSKNFGQLDFSLGCNEIYNFVRGVNPFPGCYIFVDAFKMKILEVECQLCDHDFLPGTVVTSDTKSGFSVACADGIVYIKMLQVPGKKSVSAHDFFLGNSISQTILTES